MNKPLYICEVSHTCKFNDDNTCNHAKPHAYDQWRCNCLCCPNGIDKGETRVKCIPYHPDFLDEKEFKI